MLKADLGHDPATPGAVGRVMYFVTTISLLETVNGEMPLTADEALAFIERAKGSSLKVEVRNELGNPVSEEELKREVGARRP